jgi:hypothetical protein
MAKKRLKFSGALRGPTANQNRVPTRRLSIELSERVWGRLKSVGMESQSAINKLVEEACIKVYGKATESELVLLYQGMAGIRDVEYEAPSPPKRTDLPHVTEIAPNLYASYVIEAATSVYPSGYEANQPVPKPEPRPARLDGEGMKCSKATIKVIQDLFGL